MRVGISKLVGGWLQPTPLINICHRQIGDHFPREMIGVKIPQNNHPLLVGGFNLSEK